MQARTRITKWAEPWGSAGSANNGLTADGSMATTLTRPVNDLANGRHIIDCHPVPDESGGPKDEPIHLAVAFASQNAANETYSVKGWGWRKWGDVWIGQKIWEIDLTAGALTGAANATEGPDNTWFFPDTIAIVASSDTTRGTSLEVNGGEDAQNANQFITFDGSGFELIEIETSDDGVAESVRVAYAEL